MSTARGRVCWSCLAANRRISTWVACFGTEQESGHRRYFWDYVYRSICVFAMVTRAFGDSVAGDKIMDYLDRFERSELVDEGIHGGPAASKRASAGR